MSPTPCFTLSTTPFTGTRAPSHRLCRLRAPPTHRVSLRRARALAEPEAPEPPAPSPPEKAVDVLDDAAVDPALALDPTPTLDPTPVSQTPPAPEQPVPGKIILTELELAEQRTALQKYAEELRLERLAHEREASRLFGFVRYAETLNGRLAMFFFVTGLLTEYWTGYTIPEQVELMARTLGIL